MISYRRVRKESDELSHTVWSLVMVRNQFESGYSDLAILECVRKIFVRSVAHVNRTVQLLSYTEHHCSLFSYTRIVKRSYCSRERKTSQRGQYSLARFTGQSKVKVQLQSKTGRTGKNRGGAKVHNGEYVGGCVGE